MARVPMVVGCASPSGGRLPRYLVAQTFGPRFFLSCGECATSWLPSLWRSAMELGELHVSDHATRAGGSVACLSGEDVEQRLRQLENGLHHIEALLPSMVREVERLRAGLNGAA